MCIDHSRVIEFSRRVDRIDPLSVGPCAAPMTWAVLKHLSASAVRL
jgi:hypothetical protein